MVNYAFTNKQGRTGKSYPGTIIEHGVHKNAVYYKAKISRVNPQGHTETAVVLSFRGKSLEQFANGSQVEVYHFDDTPKEWNLMSSLFSGLSDFS